MVVLIILEFNYELILLYLLCGFLINIDQICDRSHLLSVLRLVNAVGIFRSIVCLYSSFDDILRKSQIFLCDQLHHFVLINVGSFGFDLADSHFQIFVYYDLSIWVCLLHREYFRLFYNVEDLVSDINLPLTNYQYSKIKCHFSKHTDKFNHFLVIMAINQFLKVNTGYSHSFLI